eukprot:180528_1
MNSNAYISKSSQHSEYSIYSDDNNALSLQHMDDTTDYDDNNALSLHTYGSPLPTVMNTLPTYSKYNSKSIDNSYFGNYHDRNNNIPSEIHIILDKIEKDLQCIFKDKILNKENRATHLFVLVVELHQEIVKYRSKFALPMVLQTINELNDCFSLIIRLFVKFRRCKQYVSAQKKNQIILLREGIDSELNKITHYKHIIISGLNHSKTLVSKFNRNIKLLSFWIGLFPINETKYESMTWQNFGKKIRNHEACRKLKTFPLNDMIHIIQQKYGIQYNHKSDKLHITTTQFMKCLHGYNDIGTWSQIIYRYIDHNYKIAEQYIQKHTLTSPNSGYNYSPHSDGQLSPIPSPLLLDSESSYAREIPVDEFDNDACTIGVLDTNIIKKTALISPRGKLKKQTQNVSVHLFASTLLNEEQKTLDEQKYQSQSYPTLHKYNKDSNGTPKRQIVVVSTSSNRVNSSKLNKKNKNKIKPNKSYT